MSSMLAGFNLLTPLSPLELDSIKSNISKVFTVVGNQLKVYDSSLSTNFALTQIPSNTPAIVIAKNQIDNIDGSVGEVLAGGDTSQLENEIVILNNQVDTLTSEKEDLQLKLSIFDIDKDLLRGLVLPDISNPDFIIDRVEFSNLNFELFFYFLQHSYNQTYISVVNGINFMCVVNNNIFQISVSLNDGGVLHQSLGLNRLCYIPLTGFAIYCSLLDGKPYIHIFNYDLVKSVDSSLVDKNNQIAILQSQVNTLTTQKDNLQTQVNTLTFENDDLNTEISTLTTQKDNLQQQLIDCQNNSSGTSEPFSFTFDGSTPNLYINSNHFNNFQTSGQHNLTVDGVTVVDGYSITHNSTGDKIIISDGSNLITLIADTTLFFNGSSGANIYFSYEYNDPQYPYLEINGV